jgi:hypothetical protein
MPAEEARKNLDLLQVSSLLRRGFNELYMAFTVSNRCVEDAQVAKEHRNLCGGESQASLSIFVSRSHGI